MDLGQSFEMMRSAVVQKLAIIGETAARVSEELRDRHPEVPWLQIVTFCNIVVHAYFGIDWDEIWRGEKNRCPVLREQVAGIIAAGSGGSEWDAGQ
jgi:uncharacterized protein with HEPN domain